MKHKTEKEVTSEQRRRMIDQQVAVMTRNIFKFLYKPEEEEEARSPFVDAHISDSTWSAHSRTRPPLQHTDPPDLHRLLNAYLPPSEALLTGYLPPPVSGHGAPEVLRGRKLEDERNQGESGGAHQNPEHGQPARPDRWVTSSPPASSSSSSVLIHRSIK